MLKIERLVGTCQNLRANLNSAIQLEHAKSVRRASIGNCQALVKVLQFICDIARYAYLGARGQ
jgi:hypothetical protein